MKIAITFAVVVLLVIITVGYGVCGLNPNDVVVVVNNDPGVADVSRAVANYYCAQRGIPTANIVEINATTAEEIPLRRFYPDIVQPLRLALQSLGPSPTTETDPIKCLVLCPGIPIQMWGSEPVGCVDSALALMFNETPWGRAPVGAYFRWSGTRIGNPYFDSYYVSTQTANS